MLENIRSPGLHNRPGSRHPLTVDMTVLLAMLFQQLSDNEGFSLQLGSWHSHVIGKQVSGIHNEGYQTLQQYHPLTKRVSVPGGNTIIITSQGLARMGLNVSMKSINSIKHNLAEP